MKKSFKVKNAIERLNEGNYIQPSPQEIMNSMTDAGAWTALQLATWGIKWPPTKGWKKKLEDDYYEKNPIN